MFEDIPEISTLEDVEAIAALPFEQRMPFHSSYQMFQYAAKTFGERTALSFLPSAAKGGAIIDFSYVELLQCITQVGNLFHKLGVGRQDVVSYLLPNLAQTHFTIWGAQAVGIVNAVNPLLESDIVASILGAAHTKILVCVGPGLGIWEKVEAIVGSLDHLEAIVHVNLSAVESITENGQLGKTSAVHGREIPIYDFDIAIALEDQQQLDTKTPAQSKDVAAYFHTGGTTGKPKIAQHTHANELANAWMTVAAAGFYGKRTTIFVGLPLFHVNAVIGTGLATFLAGAHVDLSNCLVHRAGQECQVLIFEAGM